MFSILGCFQLSFSTRQGQQKPWRFDRITLWQPSAECPSRVRVFSTRCCSPLLYQEACFRARKLEEEWISLICRKVQVSYLENGLKGTRDDEWKSRTRARRFVFGKDALFLSNTFVPVLTLMRNSGGAYSDAVHSTFFSTPMYSLHAQIRRPLMLC